MKISNCIQVAYDFIKARLDLTQFLNHRKLVGLEIYTFFIFCQIIMYFKISGNIENCKNEMIVMAQRR